MGAREQREAREGVRGAPGEHRDGGVIRTPFVLFKEVLEEDKESFQPKCFCGKGKPSLEMGPSSSHPPGTGDTTVRGVASAVVPQPRGPEPRYLPGDPVGQINKQ